VTGASDILAAIDAVVEQRCEHCGSTIPADTGSAWFCGPACQRDWTAAHHGVEQIHQADTDRSGYSDDAMIWDPNRQEQERVWRAEAAARQREAGERRAHEERERQEWWDSLTPEERTERQRQSMAGMQEAGAVIARQITDMFKALTVALAPQLEHMAKVAKTLTDAGLIPAEPPADLRERALAHVRNRNTGPVQRQRAPQHIDPRRAR
jgi:hypothetical protein